MIKVTLLLKNNASYCFYCAPNAPILTQLRQLLMLNTQAVSEHDDLVQLIVEGTPQKALSFLRSSLIALETEPPVLLQPPPLSFLKRANILHDTTKVIQDQAHLGIEKARYLQIRDFLPAAFNQKLLHYMVENQQNFTPSSVSTNDMTYRQSRVLYDFQPLQIEFEQFLRQVILPEIMPLFDLSWQNDYTLESQVTASQNGDFFKLHNDNGSPDTASRFFTYVYYFHREPKAFHGGNLKMYDGKIEAGMWQAAENFAELEPINNSIVFFLSRSLHEVLPVQCVDLDFSCSRFTINGWVHQPRSHLVSSSLTRA